MVSALTNVSVVLFLLSALLSVIIAHDFTVAINRYTLLAMGLIMAGLLRPLDAMSGENRITGWVLISCGGLAGLLGLYSMVTGDIGLSAEGSASSFAALRAMVPFVDSVHRNVAANALVILIPLGCGGLLWFLQVDYTGVLRLVVAWLCIVFLSLALFALVWSGSRGGYVALIVALGVGSYAWWRSENGDKVTFRRIGDVLILGGVLVLILGSIVALMLPVTAVPGGILGQGNVANSVNGRIVLWQDSLALIEDYRFTGSGLGATTDVYSAYIFLLHVPYLTHAHNLYLQIAVEQGLPGLLAFAVVVCGTAWMLASVLVHGGKTQRLMAAAATAALAGLLVHGLLDAGLYSSRLVPLVFLPFAVAWSLGATVRRQCGENQSQLRTVRYVETLTGSLIAVAVVALLFLLPGARAAMQANWGAVDQTRAELTVYDWPRWPLQDVLRHDDVVELRQAENHYRNALDYDSDNVTAHRRLGQIALSTGEFDTALIHLEAAFAADPGQRVVRRLLGEAYAVTGQVDQAVAMWRSVPLLSEQLKIRRWWYEEYGDAQQQRWLDQAIARLSTVSGGR